MITTKKELQKAINNLPEEKRKSIYKKLREASMLINSVQCDLHNTELERNSLFAGEKRAASLWGEIYDIERMFDKVQ